MCAIVQIHHMNSIRLFLFLVFCRISFQGKISCDIQKTYQDYKENAGYYHCPKSNWRRLIQAIDPTPRKTALVTGCNTADDALEFLALFSPSINDIQISSIEWWKGLKKLVPSVGCGACHQCKNNFIGNSTSKSKQHPRIYCVEPQPNTARVTQQLADEFMYTTLGLIMINAAFVGSPGYDTVLFPNDSFGSEVGQVGAGVPVDALTLDVWADDNYIDILDFLILDTEGFDPKILLGGPKILSAGRVRLIEFELHGIGEWAHIWLQDILDYLESVGMICFLSGHEHIWEITYCWNEKLFAEFKFWNNIVCAPRTDPKGLPYLPILRSLDRTRGFVLNIET